MAEFVSGTQTANTYEVHLQLTEEEFDSLTIMMGMATGAAFKNGFKRLAYSFLRLANEVHKNNKKWHPYVIPEDVDGSTGTNGKDAESH